MKKNKNAFSNIKSLNEHKSCINKNKVSIYTVYISFIKKNVLTKLIYVIHLLYTNTK